MKTTVFENHPQLEKCYVTSDGTPFYQENDAKNHGKTLKDTSVETVYNENLLEVTAEEDLSEEAKEMAEFEASQQIETPEVETPEVETPAEAETPAAKKSTTKKGK